MLAEGESMSRYPFSSYPNGWFKVAFSEELKGGRVVPLRYFGKDLIAYRGQDGQANVLDAHCPHLGAHLGIGGEVVGNNVRCPFHGWQFGPNGRCVEIPYCSKIPAKANLGAWFVREVNGIVFVYHDADGRLPSFDIPVLPEFGAKDWSPYYKLEWRVKGHVEEIAENAVDYSHFTELHTYTSHPQVTHLEMKNHNFRVVMLSRRRLFGRMVDTHTDITYHGLGFVVSPVQAGKVNLIAVLTPTPIDDEYININLSILFKRSRLRLRDVSMEHLMMPIIKTEFARDIPVWENKVYHERPSLCADDGPIMKLRRWAHQFYPQKSESHEHHRRHANHISTTLLQPSATNAGAHQLPG
jgi:phenylpropionate dioxygenase-like ring-hydroxylating dioxygenase large terminal subunit